jgi:hypothetical protein
MRNPTCVMLCNSFTEVVHTCVPCRLCFVAFSFLGVFDSAQSGFLFLIRWKLYPLEISVEHTVLETPG